MTQATPPRFDAQGRVAAIDYGTVRIGLAVTDPMGWFTKGLPTLDRADWTDADAAAGVVQAFSSYALRLVVIGLPNYLDGSNSEMSDQVRAFAEILQPLLGDIPLQFVDERLSSMEAEDRLRQQGVQPSKNKGLVDQMAACILLEPFLS